MPEGASLRGAAATSIRTRQTCGAGVAAAMGAAAEELGHDIGGACDGGGGGSCGGEGAEGTGRGRDKRGLLAAGALSSSQPVPEDAELLAPTSVSSPAASAPASDVELEAPPPR